MGLRRRLPPPFHHRDFSLYWVAIVVTAVAGQMVIVAVGWQVYAIHRSALDLGLIGLMEFLPLLLLALPAGQIADRVQRKLVLAVSLVVDLLVVLALLVVSLEGAHRLWPFLVLAAGTGAAQAAGAPAGRALPPTLVPLELVPSAITMRSLAFQGSIIGGPAIGGLIFAASPEAVYAVAAALTVVGFFCIVSLHEPPHPPNDEPVNLETVLAGIRFIRETKVILGAISLDLFAVLFGGAVALLPLYARSILHTGPIGLGVMRSAPAVGAFTAGILLAKRPLRANVGKTLLVAVAIFGAATIVFGVSRSIVLTCIALAITGFVDMFSMNIRSTTVALAIPNALRGRVLAVEWVFISASNELGAFESGAAAALVGATTAVVAGGAITVGVAAVWRYLFPALATIDRFEDLGAASLEADADRAHSAGAPA